MHFWESGSIAYRLSQLYGRLRTNYLWQRTVTRCGRALGWAGPGNFLILSAARSGTTLLVDYLNCHPRIRCRGEILNSDWACYGNPRCMGPDRLRLQIESFFLRPTGMLAGAKVLTYQFDELQIKLRDVLELLDNPAIIVLYRERMLEQFVSLKTAERDRIWHSTKPAKSAPIALHPATFVAYAQRERRMWADNLAEVEGRRVHFLSYERMTQETEESMRELFEFLGLETCSVHSPLVKLHSKPLVTRLTNYGHFCRPEVSNQTILRLPFTESLPTAKAA